MIISCSLNVGLFGNVDEGSSRLGNIEKIKVFNHKGKIDNIPCHTICIFDYPTKDLHTCQTEYVHFEMLQMLLLLQQYEHPKTCLSNNNMPKLFPN